MDQTALRIRLAFRKVPGQLNSYRSRPNELSRLLSDEVMSGKVPKGIDWFSVATNLEMQHDSALARTSHVGDVFAAPHLVPFPHVQPLVVGIGTQDAAVVLDDDKLSVADESTPRIDDAPACGSPDRLLK